VPKRGKLRAKLRVNVLKGSQFLDLLVYQQIEAGGLTERFSGWEGNYVCVRVECKPKSGST
jgi:hypothetical protein